VNILDILISYLITEPFVYQRGIIHTHRDNVVEFYPTGRSINDVSLERLDIEERINKITECKYTSLQVYFYSQHVLQCDIRDIIN